MAWIEPPTATRNFTELLSKPEFYNLIKNKVKPGHWKDGVVSYFRVYRVVQMLKDEGLPLKPYLDTAIDALSDGKAWIRDTKHSRFAYFVRNRVEHNQGFSDEDLKQPIERLMPGCIPIGPECEAIGITGDLLMDDNRTLPKPIDHTLITNRLIVELQRYTVRQKQNYDHMKKWLQKILHLKDEDAPSAAMVAGWYQKLGKKISSRKATASAQQLLAEKFSFPGLDVFNPSKSAKTSKSSSHRTTRSLDAKPSTSNPSLAKHKSRRSDSVRSNAVKLKDEVDIMDMDFSGSDETDGGWVTDVSEDVDVVRLSSDEKDDSLPVKQESADKVEDVSVKDSKSPSESQSQKQRKDVCSKPKPQTMKGIQKQPNNAAESHRSTQVSKQKNVAGQNKKESQEPQKQQTDASDIVAGSHQRASRSAANIAKEKLHLSYQPQISASVAKAKLQKSNQSQASGTNRKAKLQLNRLKTSAITAQAKVQKSNELQVLRSRPIPQRVSRSSSSTLHTVSKVALEVDSRKRTSQTNISKTEVDVKKTAKVAALKSSNMAKKIVPVSHNDDSDARQFSRQTRQSQKSCENDLDDVVDKHSLEKEINSACEIVNTVYHVMGKLKHETRAALEFLEEETSKIFDNLRTEQKRLDKAKRLLFNREGIIDVPDEDGNECEAIQHEKSAAIKAEPVIFTSRVKPVVKLTPLKPQVCATGDSESDSEDDDSDEEEEDMLPHKKLPARQIVPKPSTSEHRPIAKVRTGLSSKKSTPDERPVTKTSGIRPVVRTNLSSKSKPTKPAVKTPPQKSSSSKSESKGKPRQQQGSKLDKKEFSFGKVTVSLTKISNDLFERATHRDEDDSSDEVSSDEEVAKEETLSKRKTTSRGQAKDNSDSETSSSDDGFAKSEIKKKTEMKRSQKSKEIRKTRSQGQSKDKSDTDTSSSDEGSDKTGMKKRKIEKSQKSTEGRKTRSWAHPKDKSDAVLSSSDESSDSSEMKKRKVEKSQKSTEIRKTRSQGQSKDKSDTDTSSSDEHLDGEMKKRKVEKSQKSKERKTRSQGQSKDKLDTDTDLSSSDEGSESSERKKRKVEKSQKIKERKTSSQAQSKDKSDTETSSSDEDSDSEKKKKKEKSQKPKARSKDNSVKSSSDEDSGQGEVKKSTKSEKSQNSKENKSQKFVKVDIHATANKSGDSDVEMMSEEEFSVTPREKDRKKKVLEHTSDSSSEEDTTRSNADAIFTESVSDVSKTRRQTDRGKKVSDEKESTSQPKAKKRTLDDFVKVLNTPKRRKGEGTSRKSSGKEKDLGTEETKSEDEDKVEVPEDKDGSMEDKSDLNAAVEDADCRGSNDEKDEDACQKGNETNEPSEKPCKPDSEECEEGQDGDDCKEGPDKEEFKEGQDKESLAACDLEEGGAVVSEKKEEESQSDGKGVESEQEDWMEVDAVGGDDDEDDDGKEEDELNANEKSGDEENDNNGEEVVDKGQQRGRCTVIKSTSNKEHADKCDTLSSSEENETSGMKESSERNGRTVEEESTSDESLEKRAIDKKLHHREDRQKNTGFVQMEEDVEGVAGSDDEDGLKDEDEVKRDSDKNSDKCDAPLTSGDEQQSTKTVTQLEKQSADIGEKQPSDEAAKAGDSEKSEDKSDDFPGDAIIGRKINHRCCLERKGLYKWQVGKVLHKSTPRELLHLDDEQYSQLNNLYTFYTVKYENVDETSCAALEIDWEKDNVKLLT